jgi:hypothetical protein
VSENNADGDICTKERWSGRKLKKTAKQGAAWFVLFVSIIRMIKGRKMRLAGHVTRMMRIGRSRVFNGRPRGEETTANKTRKWVENINQDLEETEWGFLGRTDLAWDKHHNILGRSLVAAQLAPSRQGISYMELISFLVTLFSFCVSELIC